MMYVENIMQDNKEALIEVYRSFSDISIETMIEYGISEYVEDIGYYMSFDDKDSIKFGLRDGLQFYICDGDIKIIYGYKNKLSVTDMNYSIRYNGRKFF